MSGCQNGWTNLPEPILSLIFSYLDRLSQSQAAQTCIEWYNAFDSPSNWRRNTFRFYQPEDRIHLKFIKRYGPWMRNITIEMDQYESCNRDLALETINTLTECCERSIEEIHMKCMGKNPLFYGGLELVEALASLFGIPKENTKLERTLIVVDLSGFPFLLEDKMFFNLADNHPMLRVLNIQNSQLVCSVTCKSMLRVIEQCRELEVLLVTGCCFTEPLLLAFTEADRKPLKHLSILYHRESRYLKEISSDAWAEACEKLPNLKVTLRFDQSCPLSKVAEVLKPEIRCSFLRLETFTTIHNELRLAVSYYSHCLERVVVQTRSSDELYECLLELSESCLLLRALHVFCILPKYVVERILEQHPGMRDKGSYTLRYAAELEAASPTVPHFIIKEKPAH